LTFTPIAFAIAVALALPWARATATAFAEMTADEPLKMPPLID
jgi:hypothetical protein